MDLILVVIIAVAVIFLAVFILAVRNGIREGKKLASRKPDQLKATIEITHSDLTEVCSNDTISETTCREAIEHFSHLPGAEIWTNGTHISPDQINRIKRACREADKIKLIAYDPRYNLAKVQGTSYRYYLTSGRQCTCKDFFNNHLPCKHMYFLGNKLTQNDEFLEVPYEEGLKGFIACLIGRFPNGKNDAIAALQERSCVVYDRPNTDTSLGVIGKTTASVSISNLQLKGTPVLDYRDALKLFTSEIRHLELEDQ